MTSRDFCFWLQGFFEIEEVGVLEDDKCTELTPDQVDVIRRHLSLVFKHEIDPSMGNKEHQNALNTIHSPIGLQPDGTVVRC